MSSRRKRSVCFPRDKRKTKGVVLGEGGVRMSGMPENVLVFEKSIFECPDGFLIVHQCNTETIKSAGLAKKVFEMEPQLAYSRVGTRAPGGITIGERAVNVYGQKYPGKACSEMMRKKRLEWTKEAFETLKKHVANNNVCGLAFPFNYGCGLAGGSWIDYGAMIKDLAESVECFVWLYRVGKNNTR